jgi:hypothetical protein
MLNDMLSCVVGGDHVDAEYALEYVENVTAASAHLALSMLLAEVDAG